MCLRGPISWGMVEKSLEELIKMLTPTGHGIDDNALFDEVTCVCSFVTQEKVAEWNENNVAVDSRWMQIFNSLQERDIILPNLKMILQFLLAIPGTNAPVERVFSLMNSYWSDEKSRLSEDTLEAVMTVKVNMEETCVEFYDRLLADKKLLRSIHSSAKYE